jgi:cell division protein FtsL
MQSNLSTSLEIFIAISIVLIIYIIAFSMGRHNTHKKIKKRNKEIADLRKEHMGDHLKPRKPKMGNF